MKDKTIKEHKGRMTVEMGADLCIEEKDTGEFTIEMDKLTANVKAQGVPKQKHVKMLLIDLVTTNGGILLNDAIDAGEVKSDFVLLMLHNFLYRITAGDQKHINLLLAAYIRKHRVDADTMEDADILDAIKKALEAKRPKEEKVIKNEEELGEDELLMDDMARAMEIFIGRNKESKSKYEA